MRETVVLARQGTADAPLQASAERGHPAQLLGSYHRGQASGPGDLQARGAPVPCDGRLARRGLRGCLCGR